MTEEKIDNVLTQYEIAVSETYVIHRASRCKSVKKKLSKEIKNFQRPVNKLG